MDCHIARSLPEPGEGDIFVQKKYNLIVTAIATLFLVVVILFVYFSERKHHQLGYRCCSFARHIKPEEVITMIFL